MAANTTDLMNAYFVKFGGFHQHTEGYEKASKMISIAEDIGNAYIWVFFAIGVPANILTIITTITMQAVCPTTFLITILAALDGTSLIAKLTAHQMVRDHVYIGNIGCKFEFTVISVSTLANLILVLVCAERFYTVCYPAKKAAIFTIRNVLLAFGILSSFIFTLYGGVSMPMRGAMPGGFRCGTYLQFKWFWINIWFWINASFYLFIPASFIIPMTVIMVRALYIRNKKGIIGNEKDLEIESDVPNAKTTSEGENELGENEGGFTIMIILAAVSFIVLCLPSCIFYLAHRDSDDVVEQAHWRLFEEAQFVLADSTHVINFFLYAASSKAFRSQVVKLVMCKPCRKRSQTAVLTVA